MQTECHESVEKLEDTFLSARDQFAEPLPGLRNKKGLIEFDEKKIAKLVDKFEKKPVKNSKFRPTVSKPMLKKIERRVTVDCKRCTNVIVEGPQN